ncbi:MAG: cytochrome c [Sphingobium sp.]|nr:cytochrome c [Sphingobium sp.]
MSKITQSFVFLSATLVLASVAYAQGGGDKAQPSAKASQMGNTGMNALQDRTASTPAGRLFVEKCAMCHRQFGMGTVLLGRRMPKDQAMLEPRKDLTKEFVIMAARQGIGNMPRIPRGEVSDAELDQIATYLARGKK